MSKNRLLILENRSIQSLYIALLLPSVILGAVRILFPFLMVSLGGSEANVSLAGTIFSIGQILGLVMTQFFKSGRSMTRIGLVALYCSFIGYAFSENIVGLLISRIIEGAGFALVGVGSVIYCKISEEIPIESQGEAIGTSLGAIFLGSAIGQGVGGILVEIVRGAMEMGSSNEFSVVLGLLLILLIPSSFSLFFFRAEKKEYNGQKTHMGHIHIKEFFMYYKKLRFLVPLALVYVLYDFSHGIYTPNLVLLFSSTGLPEWQIGLGYLCGDLAWGVVQIYAGRAVDKYGSYTPLFISLGAKGLFVMAYPLVFGIGLLILVLSLSGTSEAFLEPSRNSLAVNLGEDLEKGIEEEGGMVLSHTHVHYHLFHRPSRGEHNHVHEHQWGGEGALAVLQLLGIIAFGSGSLVGSLLLTYSVSLVELTIIGSVCLLLASGVSWRFLKK